MRASGRTLSKPIRVIFVAGLLLVCSLLPALPASSSQGVQKDTPHDHLGDRVTWKADGFDSSAPDATAHQHHDTHADFKTGVDEVPKYKALMGWRNRAFTDEDPFLGHLFIDEDGYGFKGGPAAVPRWAFCDSSDAGENAPQPLEKDASQADFEKLIKAAFDRWSAVKSDKGDLVVGLQFAQENRVKVAGGVKCETILDAPDFSDDQIKAIAKEAEILVGWKELEEGTLGDTRPQCQKSDPQPGEVRACFVLVRFTSKIVTTNVLEKKVEIPWSVSEEPAAVNVGTITVEDSNDGKKLKVKDTSGFNKDDWVGVWDLTHLLGVREIGEVDRKTKTITLKGDFSDGVPEKSAVAKLLVPQLELPAHFLTTALHEVGHVVGLNDLTGKFFETGSMMSARSLGCNPEATLKPELVTPFKCFKQPDGGSVDGARDLYSIPAPDFGDAPDPYPTKLAKNGARAMSLLGEWFGPADSKTSREADAKKDDGKSDDGCEISSISGALQPGGSGNVKLTVSISGADSKRYEGGNLLRVAAWANWNHDKDQDWKAAELLLSKDVPGGVDTLDPTNPGKWKVVKQVNNVDVSFTREYSFDVPKETKRGFTWARCRLVHGNADAVKYLQADDGAKGLVPASASPDNGGEIEDYPLTICEDEDGDTVAECPIGVGGTVGLLVGGSEAAPSPAAGSGPSVPYAASAGGAAAAVVAAAAGGWYARRRWLR